MVFCMSDWFVERVFTWYTVQIRDDTICNQCTRHCGVRVFYLNRISLKLVRLQFDLNSTMTFSMWCFSGKVSRRNWGSTRSGMPGMTMTQTVSKEEFNLDGIHFISIFDATVWEFRHLTCSTWTSLYIFAWSMYGRHSKRGYGNIWIYPVCCDYVWTASCMMCFWSGIYIRWPADAFSFVFTKYDLRLIYNMWFLEFSGNLHEANISGRVSMTVVDVFVENSILWECVFGDEFGTCFDSHDVCARQQQFPNNFISNWFCMWMVWEVCGRERLFFWTGECGRLECICNMCKCMFVETTFICCWEFVSGEDMRLCMLDWFKQVHENDRAQYSN